ncbi:MATE family efflux transporter [Streptococcus dentiloxodontae]
MTKDAVNLGQSKIAGLLRSFAIPAIIANLVNALYNIVDQIFIGQGVGYLGNAATNIAFPITTICTATALLFGIGASSSFNIEMGKGNTARARKIVGNAFTSFVVVGLFMVTLIRLFLEPLMLAFGATEQILNYAMTYTSITSIGIPFLLVSSGGASLVRGDGSAKYSMAAIVTGAVLNIIFNPLFIFIFHWGIAGSAWATVISQVISGCMVFAYLFRFRSVSLEKLDFLPDFGVIRDFTALGLTPMFNQLSVTIVQIITNNLLRSYGGESIYGSDIAIAVAGIVTKINTVYTSIILGITQGSQPILGFNFGAQKLNRVRETYRLVVAVSTAVSVLAFLIFEFFAPQIIQLFGSESALYLEYGVRYLRLFLALVFVNGMTISSTTFFSSIGKAKIGAFLALTKQLFFILPLLILFVHLLGINYIMLAAPVADFFAWCVTMWVVRNQFVQLNVQAGVA